MPGRHGAVSQSAQWAVRLPHVPPQGIGMLNSPLIAIQLQISLEPDRGNVDYRGREGQSAQQL